MPGSLSVRACEVWWFCGWFCLAYGDLGGFLDGPRRHFCGIHFGIVLGFEWNTNKGMLFVLFGRKLTS